MELKTVIVGDADVGKTCLSSRYCHGAMPPQSTPTIGASFLQKRCELAAAPDTPASEVVFQLWDTAGQERFRSMAPMYYRGAKAAVIVFDVTKQKSMDSVEGFRRDILQYADPNVIIAVAGSKADLPHEGFDLAAAEDQCEQLGVPFHLTSAETGEGVDELFVGVARAAIRVHRNHSAAASPTRGNNPLKGGKEQVSLKAASGGGKANKPCC